ncbi:Pheophorbide a oxygenase, chloroplastic [Hordeum vulgare]|nr:Pheophorbide a oxygenase, chloroplastic [Hordeum vulgare]
MWSSGRGSDNRSGGGSDPERKRHVRSDAARKRGARRWTNRGMSSPASFLVRETEELHEEAERRRHDEEIEDLQWRQAVEANLVAKAKDDEWRPIREEQKTMYIDLGSSDEED